MLWLNFHDKEAKTLKEGGSVVTEQEIIESIEELFQVCIGLDRKTLWNAVVPTDVELADRLPPGQKAVTYIPSFEFFELEEFISLVESLVNNPSFSDKDKIRLMLTGYCRIMELDLPLAIVWNLLRAAAGHSESWKFTRVSNAGVTLTCEYPREKIEEICSLSNNLSMKVGAVLNKIWDVDLRNSISHSQYFLTDNAYLPSAGLSPISRKEGRHLAVKGRSMTFDEVKVRYSLARTFITNVARRWRQACESLDQPIEVPR